MSLRSSLAVSSKVNRHRGTLMRLSTQQVARGLRLLAPTLVALSLAGIAHAQGTMAFSGAPHAHGNVQDSDLPAARRGAEHSGSA
jgi:hypothetical protein